MLYIFNLRNYGNIFSSTTVVNYKCMHIFQSVAMQLELNGLIGNWQFHAAYFLAKVSLKIVL